ncbi:MAG: hypothetical protein ACK5B9_13645, partial [Flavobacteriia bacterium]
MKNFLYLGSAILILSACKSGNENILKHNISKEIVSCIKQFEGLEIKENVFEIESTEKSVINLKNGGKIEFPANAFVDAQGNPVQGKVEIEWQEFHSLTDIILSGIPMKYDSAGVQNNFQSGGMFTIKAKQNDENVDLAPNKKAKVDLASMQDTPCYNFYKLDEEKGDWAYKTTKNGTENPNFKEEKAVEKVKEPQIIDAQVDTKAFPELQNKNIVAWKTFDKINKAAFADLASSNKLMASSEKNKYLLEINFKNKTYTYTVEPLTMEEAKRNSHKVEKKLEQDFSTELAFQNDVMTGKIIRSIEIESMGTYNWDAILHLDNFVNVVADLAFPDKIKRQAVSLFFVCPEANATIRINTEMANSEINFDPTKKFTIFGLLPDNSVITAQSTSLNDLKASKKGERVGLSFKKTDITIKNGNQLAKY